MLDPTATGPQFKVPVRDLPAHRKVTVGSDYVAKVLQGLPMRDALGESEAGTATLDAHVYGEGDNVHAHGTIRGHVTVACSRCVGPAQIPIEEEVQVTWMTQAELADIAGAHGDSHGAGDKPAEADADEGVELGEQDLDVFPYDGESVDLEPLIREQLVLAVPYAPLCREECKGLCPQCGVDKNVEACTCEKPIDPRFAALQGLKLPT